MKKIIIVIGILIVLVGCGEKKEKASKETNLVCTSETTSSISVTYEVEIEKEDTDKMRKIIRTYIAAVPEVNFENRSAEEVEALFRGQYINPNDILEGVTFEVSLDEAAREITVIATIDVAKADMKKVANKLDMLNTQKVDTFKADIKDKGYICEGENDNK